MANIWRNQNLQSQTLARSGATSGRHGGAKSHTIVPLDLPLLIGNDVTVNCSVTRLVTPQGVCVDDAVELWRWLPPQGLRQSAKSWVR